VFKKQGTTFLVISILLVTLLAGCSSQQTARPPQMVEVKAMKVIQRDTPVTYEFVGQVEAKDEVKIQAKVSGNIAQNMVNGGTVSKGQPLFQIDRRQYEAALINRQAQLAEAEAALSRVRRDVSRYQTLFAQQAISRQTLDNALAEENQAIARVEANRALVEQAQLDLQDTVITSSLDGKIDVKDLSAGNYAQAGQTVLATISSVDPVRVRFSVSENEYLRFARMAQQTPDADWGRNLKLVLSDGSVYPLAGNVEQVDRALAQETGTLTVKAVFPNPQRLLVPGMFARVVATGELRQGALLVPQRAVQEMLGKTFVTVVGEGDKAESRPVKMGPKVGNLWVVEEGISPADTVIVEGGMKTPPGTPVKVNLIQPDDLNIPAKQ